MSTPAGTDTVRSYPPPVHLLRDLGIQIVSDGAGQAVGFLPAPAEVRTGGALRAGMLALLVDAVGGSLSARAALPDRVATGDLTLHCWQPVAGPVVSACGSVLRRGRNTVVIEVALRDGTDPRSEAIGRATMTFAVIPSRPDNPVIAGMGDGEAPLRWPPEPRTGPALTRPVLEAVGLDILEPAAGHLRVALVDYVRNSFGALNGGVVATLADVSASAASGAALGRPALTRQLTLHYLAPARVGPIEARTDLLGGDEDEAFCRVEIFDAGAANRITGVATALCGPAPA